LYLIAVLLLPVLRAVLGRHGHRLAPEAGGQSVVIHLPESRKVFLPSCTTHSDGRNTFLKSRSYFTSVIGKRNQLLLIRYLFFLVTVPLLTLITDILNETKSLLVNYKSN
jgi:hypothetical protein